MTTINFNAFNVDDFIHPDSPMIFKQIVTTLLDGLDTLIADEATPYAADLHSELFNSDQFYIYHASAEKDLAELGTFLVIGAVQKYEQDSFGQMYTPLHEPTRVANMIMYILGDALLHHIFSKSVWFNDCWNDELDTADLQAMLDHAASYLHAHPHTLQQLWEELPLP